MSENVAGAVHGIAVQTGAVHGDVTVTPPAWQPPVPRELPSGPPHWTNRTTELARLREVLGHAPVVVLVGLGGVGKTALATRFAHDIVCSFPDGQLHLRLGAASPGSALGAALRSLGVLPEHIPPHEQDRLRLFRSLTHGRRLLILADDATSAEQVRPLVPSAPGSLVVVTSRVHLPDLLGEGAHTIRVGPMAHAEAATLLSRLCPQTRADPHVVAQRCAGMPLAVLATGGLMTLAPNQPTENVLSLLSTHPSVEESMTASLDAALSALPEHARRCYPLLGLQPSQRYTTPAVAALTDQSVQASREVLHLLTIANLITPAGNPDAWTMHDVTYDHARNLAAELPKEEASSATDRLIEHYLLAAAGADRALNPQRWRHAIDVFNRADDYVPTRAEGLAWWDAEGETVRALVRLAHTTGRYESAWKLVETCKGWWMLRRPFEAWDELSHLGLASARAVGDHPAEAFMQLMATGLYLNKHEFGRAEELAEAALATWREHDHTQGIGSSLEVLGVAAMAAGEPHRAVPLLEEAVRYHRLVGRERGIALMRRFLGEALTAADRPTEGLTILADSVQVFENHADVYQAAQTRISQARALLATGELGQAARVATTALTAARAHDHRYQAAKAHTALADVEATRGRPDQEARHLKDARAVFAALHAPEAEQITNRLTAPGSPDDE